MYQQMERAFRNEVESCQRLRGLEGQGVPLFLGSGRLLLEGRSFSPHVVLLEYIQDAVTLKDIAVRPKPSIISSLAKTVSAFGALGVTHNDLTLDNILFTPYDQPTRAIIIDFGAAECCEDESDEEWSYIVRGNYDAGYLKKLMVWKGWGDESAAAQVTSLL
jgi:serine/threonine protein kinase